MTTPQEQRNLRLQSDYQEMQNIKGDIIQWKPIKGEPPYVEAYEITVNIRTIIGSEPKYRDKHTIRVELYGDYPISPPKTTMVSEPQPFHPNWYSSRRWCYGTWFLSEGLGHYVIRMIRTLQFDLEITNPNSPANSTANNWFKKNLNKGIFPCDNTLLPDPTVQKTRFKVIKQPKKKFLVR
ncbi:Ubiquitin-conjugating enzyme, E2 domain protein [Candidatus Thiomargarita nelsonii]|uniref:Ubiquitin-conjugating enzyme, E2 domain protein n=1 Tax=Candidatus Thiomargarita nelsonii TaxID=1003181 RepID=A0A0A6RKA8_9GAMM|nr:Ubiquitin-conjugating enzyme, E2 domain protein [Candidatus Thiomargarita nelsonii]